MVTTIQTMHKKIKHRHWTTFRKKQSPKPNGIQMNTKTTRHKNSDKKLWDKLLKEKELDVPKTVKQIQQNTYDRKNKQNTTPEPITSN